MRSPYGRLDERFADWVDGRLKPSERAALEAEMARDPELHRAADEYRRSVQLVRSALAPGDMGGSLADAVIAQLMPKASRPPRAWRPYLASAVAAAALVLVFVVVRTIPPAEPARSDVARAPSEQLGGAEQNDAQKNVALQDRKQPLELGAVARDQLEGVRRFEGAVQEEPPPVGGAKEGEAALRKVVPFVVADVVADKDAEQRPPATGAVAPDAASRIQLRIQQPADSQAPADESAWALGLDRLALGEVALVADVAALPSVKLFGQLDARAAAAPINAAEVLALLGAATETEAKVEARVDLRQVRVTRALDAPMEAPRSVSSEKAKEGLLAGSVDAAPALQIRPTDRVYRVSGSLAELRAFATTLHARVKADRGEVVFERVQLAQAGRLALLAEREQPEAKPPAPTRAAAAKAGGRGGDPTVAPPGPSTPGPAAGSAPGSPAAPLGRDGGHRTEPRDRGARRADDQLDILLILRANERK